MELDIGITLKYNKKSKGFIMLNVNSFLLETISRYSSVDLSHQLLEKLNDYQHSLVHDWQSENDDLDSTVSPKVHDKIFAKFNKGDKNAQHISVPFEPKLSNINGDIENHLKNHGGWEIKDYRKGLAHRTVDGKTEEGNISHILKTTGGDKVHTKINHDRVNFGQVRTKTIESNLADAFDNDPHRIGHDSGLHMIISRDPHEVAGQATDKKYKSCMTLPSHEDDPNEGLNYEHIKHDLKHKNLAVFLNKNGDNNVSHATTHILLKRYISKDGKHSIYRPTTMAHGDQIDGFHHTIHEWSKKQWPAKKDTKYTLQRDLYKNAKPTIDGNDE